jgi:hypothetical protein
MSDLVTGLGSTVPQGLAAIVFLWDRFKPRQEGSMPPYKYSLLMAILLVGGTAGTVGILVWNHDHPRIQIQTVEKTVYVDKPIPCPPPLPATKTGNATNRGNNGFANTGSIGSVKQGTR